MTFRLHPVALVCFTLTAFAADSAVGQYTAAERKHWSLRPRTNPAIPLSKDPWAAQPIDAFILEKLNEQGLRHAPPASRTTLVRRVYLDLIGLPPTPAAVREFVADRSPKAYEQLVDGLLASPEYAERQARHWLDVVRFAESDGFEYDTHRSEAWQYRDYVIRSFAADKPYHQFVTEQLAGDELQPGNQEMQVAASFNRLGPYRRNAGNQDKAYIRNEILTEMTNVVGSAFLGVTLGCARCHDHKFDPIRHTDYYRMQSFFATTEQHDIPVSTEAEKTAWKERTALVNQELAALKKKLKEAAVADKAAIEQSIGVKEKQVPEPLPELKTVRGEPKLYQPVHVLLRGSSDAPAAKMGMRPLGVLLPDGAPEWGDAIEQPRLKLAQWIVDPANPLTARVMVNRLWQGHFGTGIVATPSDFGRMGTRPTHPELLDWLAQQFVANGFRIKPLHRLMVLSNTYRQASGASADGRAKDPHNRFLGSFSRRRLQAEEMRDAMLSAAGILNPQRWGPGVITPIEPELVNLLYKPDQWAVTPDAVEHNRRSIYLFQKRNMRMPFMEVFDSPDTLLSCARRESSTHAPQALELLNGAVTRQVSVALAERLQKEPLSKRCDLAFELVFGRPPVAKEREAAQRFLASSPLREFALALFAANDFLYVQ